MKSKSTKTVWLVVNPIGPVQTQTPSKHEHRRRGEANSEMEYCVETIPRTNNRGEMADFAQMLYLKLDTLCKACCFFHNARASQKE